MKCGSKTKYVLDIDGQDLPLAETLNGPQRRFFLLLLRGLELLPELSLFFFSSTKYLLF